MAKYRVLTVVILFFAAIPTALAQSAVDEGCGDTIKKDCLKNLEAIVQGEFAQIVAIRVSTAGTTSVYRGYIRWCHVNYPESRQMAADTRLPFSRPNGFPPAQTCPTWLRPNTSSLYPDPKKGPSRPVTLGRDLCGERNTVQCLAGKGNFFGRLFSASSVTFSFSQRDKVQQSVVVPNLPVFQNWQWSYDITLKPASMFIMGANWSSAVSVFQGRRLSLAPEDSLESRCFTAAPKSSLAECEKEFARRRLDPAVPQGRWTALAAILIPTFEMKALSQFDFIKQGGLLTESPLLQRTLKNLTFTWDLRNLVPQTSDRVAIGMLYDQGLKPKTDDSTANPSSSSSVASKLCVIYSGTFRSYIGVLSDWTIDSCRNVASNSGPISGYAAACHRIV